MASTRLAPGDLVSVDPKAIRFLRPSSTVPSSVDPFAALRAAPSQTATEKAAKAAAAASTKLEDVLADSAVPTPAPTTPTPATTTEAGALTPFHLPAYASPFLFIPAYAEVSFAACAAVFVRHPTARAGYSEVPTPYAADGEVVRFAWEWYAKRRPRVRSARRKAMGPIDRQRADEPVVRRKFPGGAY
jgi:hypothetical protein